MMSLARELGMTLGELGARMSSAELTDWIALARIEAGEREEGATRADLAAKASTANAETVTTLKGRR